MARNYKLGWIFMSDRDQDIEFYYHDGCDIPVLADMYKTTRANIMRILARNEWIAQHRSYHVRPMRHDSDARHGDYIPIKKLRRLDG